MTSPISGRIGRRKEIRKKSENTQPVITAFKVSPYPRFDPGNHDAFTGLAIEQAGKSRPDPGKFAVGAVLINADTGQILSPGFCPSTPTRPPGGRRLRQRRKVPASSKSPKDTTSPNTASTRSCRPTLPCTRPWSRAARGPAATRPCVSRTLGLRSVVRTVYVGIRTPAAPPVQDNGRETLEAGGVRVVYPVEITCEGQDNGGLHGLEDGKV